MRASGENGEPRRLARSRMPGRRAARKHPKPYVGDYGKPIEGGAQKASVTFAMVVLALAIGFIIGFLVFAALWLSSALTNLVWGGVSAGEAPWFAPILICAGGGLAIGLWSRYVGGDPEPRSASFYERRPCPILIRDAAVILDEILSRGDE